MRIVPTLLSALALSLPAGALLAAAPRTLELHWPHDTVVSASVAPLPGGGQMLMVVASTGGDARVLRSSNDGLVWDLVAGEGLQSAFARQIEWWGDLPGSGAGHFLIATDRGLWAYDPLNDRLADFAQGLPTDDRAIVAVDVPAPGTGGPAMLLTGKGRVHLRAPGDAAWSLALDTGSSTPMSLADVAVVTDFDPQAPAGRKRSMAATSAGRLFLSDDGGGTWTLHPQFATAGSGVGDWLIPTVAFASDFATSGDLVVGRGRVIPGRTQGDLWQSSDGGTTFSRARALPSVVLDVAAAPPAPDGNRYLYAVARGMPGSTEPVSGVLHPGVLRSGDGGATWDDGETAFDFYLEKQDESGMLSYRYRQEIAVSPDFGTDGRMYYARHEGLFLSVDAGEHWLQRQVRPERDHRGIAAARDASGDTVLAGAAYGSGLIVQRVQQGVTELPGLGCVMPPTRWSDASPRFATDGTVLLAGGLDVLCWYDPSVPPANPFGAQGWVELPLREPGTGERLSGSVQRVAFSTHYDGRGTAGSDESFFWTIDPDPGAFRTLDGGITAERLDLLVGGGFAPQMKSLAVAATYHGQNNSRDVYGVAGNKLYRLEGSQWRQIWAAGAGLKSVTADPAFSRPANPVLYVALKDAPYVAEVRDDASGVQVTPLQGGLTGVSPQVVRVPPDYAQRPVLYLGTWGRGVLRLDRSAAQPRWQPVAMGFPSAWCKSLALSPDFAQDRMVYAGTMKGAYAAPDAAGANWQPQTRRSLRDDTDNGSFTTYSPGDPANPHPTHAWPWRRVWRTVLPPELNELAFGDGVARADEDGDYFVTTVVAEEVRLWTVAGPRAGTVTIEAFDHATGQFVSGVSVDLGLASADVDHHQVTLTLPALMEVRLRVTASLDAGEVVAFDALEIVGGP